MGFFLVRVGSDAVQLAKNCLAPAGEADEVSPALFGVFVDNQ
jgi:hypothetical protein